MKLFYSLLLIFSALFSKIYSEGLLEEGNPELEVGAVGVIENGDLGGVNENCGGIDFGAEGPDNISEGNSDNVVKDSYLDQSFRDNVGELDKVDSVSAVETDLDFGGQLEDQTFQDRFDEFLEGQASEDTFQDEHVSVSATQSKEEDISSGDLENEHWKKETDHSVFDEGEERRETREFNGDQGSGVDENAELDTGLAENEENYDSGVLPEPPSQTTSSAGTTSQGGGNGSGGGFPNTSSTTSTPTTGNGGGSGGGGGGGGGGSGGGGSGGGGSGGGNGGGSSGGSGTDGNTSVAPSNNAALVGGSVAGALLGAGALGGLSWFFLNKKKEEEKKKRLRALRLRRARLAEMRGGSLDSSGGSVQEPRVRGTLRGIEEGGGGGRGVEFSLASGSLVTVEGSGESPRMDASAVSLPIFDVHVGNGGRTEGRGTTGGVSGGNGGGTEAGKKSRLVCETQYSEFE
ncbi:putative Secreted Protein [Cryptosporidium felis]|nr:putative Secreted Protein [Cryptosporidium felis]